MSLIFPPTFEYEASSSFSDEQGQHLSSRDAKEAPPKANAGGFAAFICHVAYLEDKLQRGAKSRFFGKTSGLQVAFRTHIGSGVSSRSSVLSLYTKEETEALARRASCGPKEYVAVSILKLNRNNS